MTEKQPIILDIVIAGSKRRGQIIISNMDEKLEAELEAALAEVARLETKIDKMNAELAEEKNKLQFAASELENERNRKADFANRILELKAELVAVRGELQNESEIVDILAETQGILIDEIEDLDNKLAIAILVAILRRGFA